MPATIAVVGTGYVGLTTGVGFAHLGHQVVCADIDPAKITKLQAGQVPIHEANLPELLAEAQAANRIHFVHGAETAVTGAEFVFLCLPTPKGESGEPDMGAVHAVAETIGPLLPPGTVVVNKSTVPIGASRTVAAALGRPDCPVVSNPEFLREGSAMFDVLNPQRIVVGADENATAARVADLYRDLDCPVVLTDPASAEACKYAANAFLAMKLSFVNTMAAVCEAFGADIEAVTRAMGYDERIGPHFLVPGPGFGGSCFPKDTQALITQAERHDIDVDLLRDIIAANEQQFDRVVTKVAAVTALDQATVAVLGLTFKAGTDDTRDSPALAIIDRLLQQGAKVHAHDPALTNAPGDVEFFSDPYLAATGADAIIIATEWPEYADLDLARLADVVGNRHLIDTRNLLTRAAAEAHGFTYQSTGRA